MRLILAVLTLVALSPAAAADGPSVQTPLEAFGPAAQFSDSLCTPYFGEPGEDPPAPGTENLSFVDFGTVANASGPHANEHVTGHFARPYNPRGILVVFFHGYSHLSDSWIPHLREAAANGLHAVAIDYRGHRIEDGFDRGWEVFNAAEDGIHVANLISGACGLQTQIAFGVSMGGNSSGIAVSSEGSPFDYWFDVEGASNIIEESTGARLLRDTGAFIRNADDDIVAAYGGRIEDNPARYIEGTVVTRADRMTGLKGAFVVHGVDDGLVPYNQGAEMFAALVAAGVPTENYTVVTRGTSEGGTTLTGTIAEPVLGSRGYESSLAGHASEASTTHRVMRTALDRLYTLTSGLVGHLGTSLVPLI